MSYYILPSYKHYWQSSPDLGAPLISEAMTLNRFQDILSNLHVNDNGAIPKDNKDKLYTDRPLLETLNNQFSILYHGTR
ncbi:hypothetical protein NQ314_003702 [Rhamnusium bicolor]|uniref:PiggyBac transposable element-derived protein domain-containing protein n=1 Tax=Rhamnusium bicolor TaxID=1586634 RepID=A0AAV8ZNH6_9CUCU|nr:hypothetical protein NQ314_003702 [Rhamnusium bicolor]